MSSDQKLDAIAVGASVVFCLLAGGSAVWIAKSIADMSKKVQTGDLTINYVSVPGPSDIRTADISIGDPEAEEAEQLEEESE